MSPITWRNPYDQTENDYYDQITAKDYSKDPGMTLQAPAEEQDINVIMKRFGVKDGSVLPRWQDPNALYGDFSEMPRDPVEATEYLRQGEVAFMTLPADVRTRFGSGAKLYEWMLDRRNAPEAVKLGLLREVKKEPAPTLTPPAPAAAPPAAPTTPTA